MIYFEGVIRTEEKKRERETTEAASVGASLASGCFLKKASPQLDFQI